jgi:vancomycin resistance protein YoaR
MEDVDTETSADAPLVVEPVPEAAARPAHFGAPRRARRERSRRRWALPLLLTPAVLVLVLVLAWAVDSSSDDVPRNVELAGADISGFDRDQLADQVGETASAFADTPVELVAGDVVHEASAEDLGLALDEEATAQAALDVGDSSFLLARPFAWGLSFVTTREAPVLLRVDEDALADAVIALEGDGRTPPTEPAVELVDGQLDVVPGKDGEGLDTAAIARQLPGVAEAAIADDLDVVRLEVQVGPIAPLGTDEAAAEAAAAAEDLLDEPVAIRTSGGDRTITPDQLHRWARLTSDADGTVDVAFDEASVAYTLRQAFADVDGHPVDASFTLEGGVPVIRPDAPGTICCAPGAAAKILDALHDDTHTVELELTQGPANFTVADAQAFGVKQAVGGNHAWRDGAPTTAGPGFTTYHDPTGARITNIHRMADLVRGAVIPPGGSFSINGHVGERTAEKGFVAAGAIRDGMHVEEIGGGVSQFATTMFNAVYFAGLQIDESQAHSEYFDRYPRGREATMGYPAPDLRFTNDTPYGIMIWTSYTQSSLTITLYSTPHARGEQTAISESSAGSCTVVTTTRTVTYPDGTTRSDKFRATYRPGEGQRC